MQTAEMVQFVTNIGQCFEAFNAKVLSEKAIKAWFYALKDFSLADVTDELDGWLRTQRKPPTVADLIDRLNNRISNRVERTAAQHKAEAQHGADLLSGRITPHPEARANIDRMREMMGLIRMGPAARDPLFWAKHPGSGKAIELLITGAKHDRRLREILAEHVADSGARCRNADALAAVLAYAERPIAWADATTHARAFREPGSDDA